MYNCRWLPAMCSWSLHLSFGRSGFLRPQGMYPTARLDSFRTQAAATSFSCLQFCCSCFEHLILFRRSFFFDHSRHLDVIWTKILVLWTRRRLLVQLFVSVSNESAFFIFQSGINISDYHTTWHYTQQKSALCTYLIIQLHLCCLPI